MNYESYTTPYKFTGKELDKETGLYYHGHRYRDSRLGGWMSADPALSRYLPVASSQNSKLPAGGVFVSVNLNLYHYGGNNPVIYLDPDGLFNLKTGEIEKGDTLKDITKQLNDKYGTKLSIHDVARANNIKNPDKIRAGDFIALPGANPMLKFDLKKLSVYDTLYKQNIPSLSWSGTSGRTGYQDKKFQNLADKGPIPEGSWLVDPSRTQPYDSISTVQKIKGLLGGGEWPGGRDSWGDYRTWLSPLNVPKLYNRSGFSIHGGETPGSAGCIDLAGENNSFHNWLLNYGRPVVLDISY